MSKIVIGEADKKPLKLDVDLLIPSRLLIQANSGGGKSWLLRRLAEQLYGEVQTIIIDPEGEFYTLREKFGYVLVGQGGETPCDVRSAAMLAERFLELKASAVCDLFESFRSQPMARRQWVRYFLNALLDAPRALWHPLIVIVDEAHKFCPQESPKAASMQDRETINACKEAMIGLSTTGRKRGFCPVWATQRLAKLDKDASAEFFNRLVGMTIEDVDVDRAADLMSVSKDTKHEFRASLRSLNPGEFYAFGRAITTDLTLVKVGDVQTHHPETGKAAKNETPPPTPDDVKRFLPQLSDLPKEAEDKIRTEAEYKKQIQELKRELASAQKGIPKVPKESNKAPQIDARAIDRAVRQATAPLVKQLTLAKQKAARVGQAVQHLQGVANGLAAGLTDIENLEIPQVVSALSTFPGDAEARTAPPATHSVAGQRPAVPVAPDVAGTNGDAKLSGPQLEMLRRLSQFRAMGRDSVSLSWLAASLGTTVRARGFEENTRVLRKAALVAPGHGREQIQLSQAGLAIAGEQEAISGDELREKVKSMLSGPQIAYLDRLISVYPGTMQLEQLAENYFQTTVRARGFEENTRFLRSNHLIEVQSGAAKAADWLFE